MAKSNKKKGERYEELALWVMTNLADFLGLAKVEGKHKLPGKCGTEWEADIVGYGKSGKLVKVECKFRKTTAVNQAEMMALWGSMCDTGAESGIMVSRRSVQKGAAKVARGYSIKTLVISSGKVFEEYKAQIDNFFFVGAAEVGACSDYGEVIVTDENGKVERHGLH